MRGASRNHVELKEDGTEALLRSVWQWGGKYEPSRDTGSKVIVADTRGRVVSGKGDWWLPLRPVGAGCKERVTAAACPTIGPWCAMYLVPGARRLVTFVTDRLILSS